MDRFLKIHNLLKLSQEEIEKLNGSIFWKEIEFIVKNLSAKKTPSPAGFTGEFYQLFKEEITSLLHKLF